MALAPLNRRVQLSKYRAQSETDRTIYQYGNPVPTASMQDSSSVLPAKKSAHRRSASYSLGCVSWDPWVIDDKTGTQSYRKLASQFASQRLYEQNWRLDDSWTRGTWAKVEKVARPFHLRLARVFEYKPKICSVALHKGHAHPDNILTLGNTNDDMGLLSNDHMPREFVESWKAGPGRKKAWRTAPRLRFANKDRIRLLRCSQQRKAIFPSCPMPLRESELVPFIRPAPISSSVPTIMLRHGMVDKYSSQTYPEPSTVKKFARRLGIPSSNRSRPRTRSEPFFLKADRLDDGDDSDGVDDEEDDDDSFEPGPSCEHFQGDLFPDMGDEISKDHLPKSGSRGRRSKVISLTHLIAYESFIGVRLSQTFRLQGLIRIESCYDLYAVEPMFETSQIYEARAYVFQGLKYEERKYRMRHFKRCQSNRFCEQSFEQRGKKWVVSRCGSKNEEEVLVPSPSPHASCKDIPVVPLCNRGKPSGSPSQIPTTEVPKQLDRMRERMRNHTPDNIRIRLQKWIDTHPVIRPSLLQSQADSVQINLERAANLGDDDTPAVAEGSATTSSSSRPPNGQETTILPFSYHKEKAGDSTFGSRKRKSPEQLERRKERRRRAQQVRRMMKSDKQNPEPTPRVFMQWEKSEVQRLLYKQWLTLKSAHQAELQKQAAIMSQREQQHKDNISMLFHPANHHIRRWLLLLDRVDDGVLWAIKNLLEARYSQDPTRTYEELYYEMLNSEGPEDSDASVEMNWDFSKRL